MSLASKFSFFPGGFDQRDGFCSGPLLAELLSRQTWREGAVKWERGSGREMAPAKRVSPEGFCGVLGM